ncbi:MAG: SDR family oxidoreductase [Rhodospirillaceae bacterium]|jgi:NAD(P)-dependent dehydrogenase (short-subunit alcohol dehydrogenase family)|nr:SDR family oxidoreductase [Rhodospirillaceae bacterium]MBT6116580.1 SDR family oxidoreductase [Rhodospirillaceae bacterium]
MPTAMVTGANRGIGLEFARQYAADGWRVIATCRNPDGADDLKSLPGDVTIQAMDVGDPASIRAARKAIGDAPIDALINNAGLLGGREQDFGKTDYDTMAEVLRVNVIGPLAVAEAFVGNLEAGEGKRLATVSSRIGSIGENGSGGRYIYRPSKAGVNAVMKSVALDLAGRGIHVAILHPGHVRTDMGGPKAPVSPEDSVRGMRAVIDGLTLETSGQFFNYDGTEIAW